jgi:hypothetical protein
MNETDALESGLRFHVEWLRGTFTYHSGRERLATNVYHAIGVVASHPASISRTLSLTVA